LASARTEAAEIGDVATFDAQRTQPIQPLVNGPRIELSSRDRKPEPSVEGSGQRPQRVSGRGQIAMHLHLASRDLGQPEGLL